MLNNFRCVNYLTFSISCGRMIVGKCIGYIYWEEADLTFGKHGIGKC